MHVCISNYPYTRLMLDMLRKSDRMISKSYQYNLLYAMPTAQDANGTEGISLADISWFGPLRSILIKVASPV